MATPMTADRLVAALRAEGLTVVEVDGWRTNNRNHKGPWGPVHGVMIHHTVTSGTASSVALCYGGHSNLPGPLCHGVIAKDGVVYLVGNGRANHAGLGDPDVLQAVKDEAPLPPDNEATADGNRAFYGFEAINLGDGKDLWPEVQLEAIERTSAAICRAHQWTERAVIGHLEWQPGKVDPRGFTMASMRARIGDRLEANTPPPQEEDMTPEQAAQLKKLHDQRALAPWTYKGATFPDRDAFNFLVTTDANASKALAGLVTLAAKVDALTATVADLDDVELSPEQLAELAAKVAASPVLAESIAELVADKLAARLAE
ncbi:peptidoglycan recognition protein family protein [Streptomyces lunaelactis]|uniref:peptidoglycan recognition protein family protein n=1 Tax=Streptomyces lunaelactis TaxID=1535768 RepID=UPI00158583B0|nr:peptidoglycan recognition family protein [Streptomyces lunaelactis]NUL09060.1 N-acetylmuramoyl-L-alanine amidase [Streptomyces lunaelactis]